MKQRKIYRCENLFTAENINARLLTNGLPVRFDLPDGCVGIQFIFKTKKSLKAFIGKGAIIVEGIMEEK